MDNMNSEPPRTSKLAIASLVSTFFSCCGPCGLVPIVLSVVSIVRIRLDPALRGMGIAVVALILNLGVTVATSFWAVPKLMGVFNQVFGLMLAGPADAIRAGQSGDVEAFLGAVRRGGPNPPDTEDASVFLNSLTERFGQIQSSVIQDQNRGAPVPGATDAAVDYMLTFTKDGKTSAIKCEVVWSMANDAGDLDVKIKRIRVFSEDGEIAFPPKGSSVDEDSEDEGDEEGDAGDGGADGTSAGTSASAKAPKTGT